MTKLLAAIAALGLIAACAPAQQAPQVRLYALDCGRIAMSDAGAFADSGALDGQARGVVDPCYLIRHPDGDLLWDLGLPDSLADTEGGVVSGPFHLTVTARLADQLAQLGLTPADIDYIAISHSHFDHVGNAGLFAATATWIADIDERAWMFREEARAEELFSLIAPLEDAATVEITGDHDVFGDGSVTIIRTPGHTPGHNILLVRLANAGPVLLTGDMFHMPESRAQRLVPAFNTDREQTLASMDRIDEIEAETGARVIRQHVEEDFVALPAFPEGLD